MLDYKKLNVNKNDIITVTAHELITDQECQDIFNKLKEEGLESFYTSADESTIRSIVDVFIHCRNK